MSEAPIKIEGVNRFEMRRNFCEYPDECGFVRRVPLGLEATIDCARPSEDLVAVLSSGKARDYVIESETGGLRLRGTVRRVTGRRTPLGDEWSIELLVDESQK